MLKGLCSYKIVCCYFVVWVFRIESGIILSVCLWVVVNCILGVMFVLYVWSYWVVYKYYLLFVNNFGNVMFGYGVMRLLFCWRENCRNLLVMIV